MIETVIRKRSVGDMRGHAASEHVSQRYEGARRFVTPEGEELAILVYPKVDWSEVRRVLGETPAVEHRRGSIERWGRVFGATYSPDTRRSSTSPSSRELPLAHAAIETVAREVDRVYREMSPRVYRRHQLRVSRKDRCLAGTLWTSADWNRDLAIEYHRDGYNLEGAYTGMLVLRQDCEGGDLVIPEWDCRVALEDGAVWLFDGSACLHGVTPLSLSPGGYRWSLPCYVIPAVACGAGSVWDRRR